MFEGSCFICQRSLDEYNRMLHTCYAVGSVEKVKKVADLCHNLGEMFLQSCSNLHMSQW